MPSPSAKDLRRWKTERFPAIGKGICWPVPRTPTLPLWWSAIRAFAMLIKVPSKNTEVVVAFALSQHVRKLPATLKRSLTWDRGLEMAKHKDFTVATDVKVHFCDPQSPWQRGTNENTNLPLRQYFPRGTDLSIHSQAQSLDS